MSPKVRHTYVEEIEWFHETWPSRGAADISRSLGIQPGSVARALYREGRPDLAWPFTQLERSLRPRKRTRICRPCRTGNHQEHRIYLHDSHKCQCSPCRSTDNARK